MIEHPDRRLDRGAVLRELLVAERGPDLRGERAQALVHYRRALEFDTGRYMTHSQFGMRIDRRWIEKRLETPFSWDR